MDSRSTRTASRPKARTPKDRAGICRGTRSGARTPRARRTGASFVSKRADAAVGVDAKAVVRDSIVIDGTINPDFSQVESDQPQITVNKPFEVFFPEKRPFFLENANYFSTAIPLLFTRRIAD